MPNPYNHGGFLWYWYEWTFPVIVAAIALSIGLAIFLSTNRRTYGTIVRTLAVLAFVGTIPLAEERIGIGISATDGGVAAISLLGGFGSMVLGGAHLLLRGSQRYGAQAGGVSYAAATAGTAGAITGPSSPRRAELAAAPEVAVAPDITIIEGGPPPPAWLVFQSGPSAGQTIPLSGATTVIGRAPASDVVVDDEGASRRHAEITLVDGRYLLSDAGSSSGTMLEGAPAGAATPLDSGATVRIGDTDLLFMQGRTGAATMLASPGESPDSGVAALAGADAAQTIVAAPPRPKALMAWLAVTDGPSKGATCQVKNGETTIGRAEHNELVVRDAAVSRSHALVVGSDKGMRLLDLASSGGTQLNREPLQPARLSTASVITIGETELMLVDVESEPEHSPAQAAGSSDATVVEMPAGELEGGVLVARKGPDAGKTFHLVEGDNLIGRVDANILLTDPQASRRHAVIRRSGESFIIYDLGSTAGTSVDGHRVEGVPLKGGDTIFMGGSTIVAMEPAMARQE